MLFRRSTRKKRNEFHSFCLNAPTISKKHPRTLHGSGGAFLWRYAAQRGEWRRNKRNSRHFCSYESLRQLYRSALPTAQAPYGFYCPPILPCLASRRFRIFSIPSKPQNRSNGCLDRYLFLKVQHFSLKRYSVTYSIKKKWICRSSKWFQQLLWQADTIA